jgi:Phosphotransferase enzyme family
MLDRVLKAYFGNKEVLSISSFGNGHINETYKVSLKQADAEYILQKINTNVFINVKNLIDNHLKLQSFLEKTKASLEIPILLNTINGEFEYLDSDGKSWRLLSFIKDSYSIETVTEAWEAKEAGEAFGYFANLLSSLDVDEFKESIKNFHSLRFRLDQLYEAIQLNAVNRVKEVVELSEFYRIWEDRLLVIEENIKAGKIPVRIVHNDTKINNLLFRKKKACAVIDLDTLGPGTLYYDYGDALRTIGNAAAEDEKDIDKVFFNLDNFNAFSRNYLAQVKSILSFEEKEYFYLAPFLMTFIMGIRFLTDFLNGDLYYKTLYPEHNLVRSRVQMRLIQLMEDNIDKIRFSVDEILKTKK